MNPTQRSDLYSNSAPVGVLKGFSALPHQLEVDIVVPHQGGDLPGSGEFLLVEKNSADAVVGRVGRYHASGPLASDRGDSYLADMIKEEAAMPDDVARHVLRYNLKMQLLGNLHWGDDGFEFSVGERTFAPLGCKVRHPSDAALAFLCNVGLEDDPTAAPLGHLVYGQREMLNVPVRFSVARLKGRRSFVFARAGYGKSNLIKHLVAQLYSSPPDVGLLIFDPEGEYALPDAHGRSGLVNVPGLRERISLYTNRPVPSEHQTIFRGTAFLNLGDFPPSDIAGVLIPSEKQDTVFANLLRSMEWDSWKRLAELLATDGFSADGRKIAALLDYKPNEKDVSLAAIRNNLVPAIRRLHREDANLAKNVIQELREARVVIVDTSLFGSEDAFAVTKLLMHRVFQHNIRHLTDVSGPTVRCLVVLEEAQSFLGARILDETNVFVRWVKEGRKYGLGAILITQQPGAISDQIISQGDNFFALHLLNQNDLQALQRHNAHYTDEILNFIRSEPIRGNCYFWSAPSQPFVLPVRVTNFETICARPKTAAAADKNVSEPRALIKLVAGAVKHALESSLRLWLYRVSTLSGRREAGWIAFSKDYLIDIVARKIGEDDLFNKMPDGNSWLAKSLPGEVERVLARHKVRFGFAVLEGVTRPVWSIPESDIRLTKEKQIRAVAVEVTTRL